MVEGVIIGFLIGLISGLVSIILLGIAVAATVSNVAAVSALIAELLAMPTFWLGGPWMSTAVFKLVELDQIFLPYLISLAITFIAIVIYPTIIIIAKFGEKFKK